MKKYFLVWPEGCSREYARRLTASSHEHAAREWAEWTDSGGSDYLIVGGQDERVFVAADDDGSEPELFIVSGRPSTVYFARPVGAA